MVSFVAVLFALHLLSPAGCLYSSEFLFFWILFNFILTIPFSYNNELRCLSVTRSETISRILLYLYPESLRKNIDRKARFV